MVIKITKKNCNVPFPQKIQSAGYAKKINTEIKNETNILRLISCFKPQDCNVKDA